MIDNPLLNVHPFVGYPGLTENERIMHNNLQITPFVHIFSAGTKFQILIANEILTSDNGHRRISIAVSKFNEFGTSLCSCPAFQIRFSLFDDRKHEEEFFCLPFSRDMNALLLNLLRFSQALFAGRIHYQNSCTVR